MQYLNSLSTSCIFIAVLSVYEIKNKKNNNIIEYLITNFKKTDQK